MHPSRRLSAHQFEQQKKSLSKKLESLGSGNVDDALNPRDLRERQLTVYLYMPGHGLPTTGTIILTLEFDLIGSNWELVEYVYEYRRSNRLVLGFHYHPLGHTVSSVPHIKCMDERRHFDGDVVDVFTAVEAFRDLQFHEATPDCSGLTSID